MEFWSNLSWKVAKTAIVKQRYMTWLFQAVDIIPIHALCLLRCMVLDMSIVTLSTAEQTNDNVYPEQKNSRTTLKELQLQGQ